MAAIDDIRAAFAKLQASYAAFDTADQKTQADTATANGLAAQANAAAAVVTADQADESKKKTQVQADIVSLEALLGPTPPTTSPTP